MPIFPIPPNVVTGGTILASDVSSLYNDINGLLDSQNIAVGGILTVNLGSASVAAGNLKTSFVTLTVQQAAGKHFGGAFLTVTSGVFSFWPGILTDGGAASHASIGGNVVNDTDADFTLANPKGIEASTSNTATSLVWLAVLNTVNLGTNQASAIFWFVSASPPYDLGDGEVELFVFVLLDSAGTPKAIMTSHDPPWHGKHETPKLILPHSLEDAQKDPVKSKELMDALEKHGNTAKLITQLRDTHANAADPERKAAIAAEIDGLTSATFLPPTRTPQDKNANMGLVPHPFIGNNPADWTGHGDGPWTVVMLDPMDPNIHKLSVLHDSGENVNTLIHNGYLKLGDKVAKRAGPPGVTVVSHAFKNTGA